MQEGDSLSDHCPVALEECLPSVYLIKVAPENESISVNWKRAHENDIIDY